VDDLISTAVAAMRRFPSHGDVELYRMLVAGWIEKQRSRRVSSNSAHGLLSASQRFGSAIFEYLSKEAGESKNSSERLLSSEPVWNAVIAFARDEAARGISRDDLLAVAGRSAEFQAVNQMLNQGSNLRDIVLTPTLLTWAEAGPDE
jgi:hypothetical protein